MTSAAVTTNWPRTGSQAPEVALGAAALVATTVSALACRQVATPVTADQGLVAILPTSFWVGFTALNLAMLVALARPRVSPVLMTLLQLCLCFVVYAAPALITAVPRTEVAWRHLGVTQALMGLGSVDPDIDAYFNWPGFFAGLGTFLSATGLDGLPVALWAPLAGGVLWLAGVALIVRVMTPDAAHRWMALWVFTLGNWIDQDYLSPQAIAFFLYLVVLALLLGPLAARPAVGLRPGVVAHGLLAGTRSWWRSRTPTEPRADQRISGLLVVVMLCAALVVSHQLTPFLLLAAVTALTVTGRTWAPGLVLLLTTGVVLWLTTGASSYLMGHPIIGVESARGVAAAGLGDRLAGGSAGHTLAVQVRTGLTVVWWVLAAAGAWRLHRASTLDLRVLLLAAAPFLLVPANSYGGEMVLRATLFAAPFTAYLAAVVLLPRHSRREVPHPAIPQLVTGTAVLTVLSVGLVTARYGNARFDIFTEAEVQGSQVLYASARPGELLIAGARPTPWRYRDYATYPSTTLTETCRPDLPLAACLPLLRAQADGSGALLMLNRAHAAAMDMQGLHSSTELAALEEILRRAARVHLIYVNGDVRIYRLDPTEPDS